MRDLDGVEEADAVLLGDDGAEGETYLISLWTYFSPLYVCLGNQCMTLTSFLAGILPLTMMRNVYQ